MLKLIKCSSVYNQFIDSNCSMFVEVKESFSHAVFEDGEN